MNFLDRIVATSVLAVSVALLMASLCQTLRNQVKMLIMV